MSAEAEARRLTIVGLVLALCLVGGVSAIVIDPFGGGRTERFPVVIDVPYVGQGVTEGTSIMMHGVKVGDVTAVSSRRSGGVRLNADLQSIPTQGLTDSLGIDFRPANYFGVTAINLIPGTGGQPLGDGTQVHTVPKGNFTLQTLLSRLGEITGGVVTQQLIRVIDRATRYTDGLNPLIETVLVVSEAVTKVQTVSTEQLLRNTAGISVAFPSALEGLTAGAYNFTRNSGLVTHLQTSDGAVPLPEFADLPVILHQPVSDAFWHKRDGITMDVMSFGFFGVVGQLLRSHTNDLMPAIGLVKTLTDVVPGLVTPKNIASDLVELRTRLEKLYAGSPEQRAVQVHIVLDKLPGVAAPIDAMGGTQ